MKKILLILFGLLFVSGAYSAQIANVEYVHKMIEQTWDITVPYNDALNSVKQIANMKYLLSAIDVANHMLNGSATTDYANGEFATLQVADVDTVNTAVETLIVGDGTTKRNYKFFITTTSNTTSFKFYLSAAGEFYVDWGDGTRNKITRTNTQNLEYSHNYSTAGTYTIKIGGKATAYNTSTNIAAISFSNLISHHLASNIASIDGSLGAIFGTLTDGKQPRFYSTFYGASNMKGAIPANLFAGISGAPVNDMFYGTFQGCSGLTGAIPDGLFAGISGAPAPYMFASTFHGCSGLTSIPAGLFAGISGAPVSFMFSNTFYGCSGLTSIPAGLFAGISGVPAFYMFSYTFSGCSKLTSIPENLFAGISGAPEIEMFSGTFSGCSGLTSIPSDLFAGISGKPAGGMFASTFSGCSGLTGAIPDGLFGNLSGAPAWGIFAGTFEGCSGLTSIPENLFGNISGLAQDDMFRSTFSNCTSLTGPSARINGQYLYEIWPDATGFQVGNMYSNATGLEDYRCIPTVWGGGGENCSAPAPEFTLTTTDDTDSFEFSISAAGEFVVDWGDGTVETITKPDTTNTIYSHDYTTAGAYTIGFSGQATAYNTDEYTAAIGFVDNLDWEFNSTGQIASIDGSLGAIFGTLSSDTNNQPRFYQTFYGAYNMEGTIPENLFAGISGAPANAMFQDTFNGCSGLTGAIPSGLFAGISGAPADSMFNSTFAFCAGLTSIPDGLFAGISGAPASSMFYGTFYDCFGLTGAIPSGLFAGISGAPAESMFAYTFSGCGRLTGAIPSGLFAGISGAPAEYMFDSTFAYCTGLTSIPAGLFAGISGAPASFMFRNTFDGCSGLTSIPENLFGNISGPAQSSMFYKTFYNCTSLTGPSARINGQYLYEIWPSATSSQVGDMYYNATGLSDYSSTPSDWK